MEVVHQNRNLKGENQEKNVDPGLYEVLKNLPKPETNMRLNAAQKKWWYWFGCEFIKTDQFTKADLMHLQQAAFWMDARSQAIKEVNRRGMAGLVQVFNSGATNVTGYVSIIEKADKHLADVSAHFGLSFKDRQRLKNVKEDDGQLDLFSELKSVLEG